MVVALRGSLTTASNASGSLSISAPTGLTSGDVIVIWVVAGAAITTTCTGFSSVPRSLLVDAETMLYRTADGTEGSSFSLSPSGTSNGMAAVCAAFSGAAGGGSFWDPSTPAGSAATSGANNAPSIVGLENSSSKATTVNGDMLLWTLDIFGTSGTASVTYPSGFSGALASQNSSVNAALGYKSQTSAGTAGTQAGSISGLAGTQWAAQLVAITASASVPTYAPPNFRGSFVPQIRASHWRQRGKSLSRLILPEYPDIRLLGG